MKFPAQIEAKSLGDVEFARGHMISAHDYCDKCIELGRAHDLARVVQPLHDWFREGVYGSLLKQQRQGLHKRCAEWFADDDLVLHAEHLDHAGDPRAANAYLEAARDQAGQYRYSLFIPWYRDQIPCSVE